MNEEHRKKIIEAAERVKNVRVKTEAAISDEIRFYLSARRLSEIDGMMATGATHITLTYQEMADYDRSDLRESARREAHTLNDTVLTDLAVMLVDEPDTFRRCATTALKDIMREVHYTYWEDNEKRFSVRLAGLEHVRPLTLAELGPEFEDKLVCIDNTTVDAISGLQSRGVVVEAYYYCTECDHAPESPFKSRPRKCPACGEEAMRIEGERSQKEMMQYFRVIQEGIPSADARQRMQRTAWVDARGTLTNTVQAGERIRLHAVVRSAAIRGLEAKKLPVQNVAYGHMVTFYLEAVEIERLTRQSKAGEVTPAIRAALRNWLDDKVRHDDPLAALPYLVRSFASAHYGDDWLKLMLLLNMVSGSHYVNRKRAWMNLLLVGDSSTGKTTLLTETLMLVDAIYMAGEGISEAGMGAAVVREEGVGLVARRGFGSLGDMMVHVLDEADKMGETKKEAKAFWDEMGTMMENGVYFNMRGGIRANMQARGPWIIAMNPTYEIYDPYKSLPENVSRIPNYTLTRFDVFAVLRTPKDTDVTDKIIDLQVDLWGDRAADSISTINTGLAGELDPAEQKSLEDIKMSQPQAAETLLMQYLAYYLKIAGEIKVKPWPEESKAEVKALAKRISRVVNKSEGLNYVQRHTESIMRMCDALVRLCWQDRVALPFVKFAEKQLEFMYAQINIDINAPTVDLGSVYNKSAGDLSKMKTFDLIFNGMAESGMDGMVDHKALVAELLKVPDKWKEEQDARSTIDRMSREGQIYEVHPGVWKRAR